MADDPPVAVGAAAGAAVMVTSADTPVGAAVARRPGAETDLFAGHATDPGIVLRRIIEDVHLVATRPDVVTRLGVELEVNRVGVEALHAERERLRLRRRRHGGEENQHCCTNTLEHFLYTLLCWTELPFPAGRGWQHIRP